MKNKAIFTILLLGVILFSGCTANNNNGSDVQPTGEVKEFKITAKSWEFIPETITVNKGDTIKLTITSMDVAHGFNLPSFGINERLDSGMPVEVEFVADKVGSFSFSCSIPCGSGHRGMKGQLIVK